MAILFNFPSFPSLSSHKLFSFPLTSLNSNHHTNFYHHHYGHTTICDSSIKRSRTSRKVKSNVELCYDIREFITAVGLPEGHVPTMKELSQHGRQDLANIVRRRGYKVIRELLAISTETNINDTGTEERLTEKQDTISSREKESTDSGFGILNESIAEEGKEFTESQNATEPESSCIGEEHNSVVLCRTDAAKILDGNSTLSSQKVAHPMSENGNSRQSRKKENEAEINRLKFRLHQKELELSQLKEQIEKEKLALSIMQTKAETEISKAQKLVSEKDEELHTAEESLSGLKEVEIQYEGDAETVEVTGSFNGWHHRIKMDLQLSPNAIDPAGSRLSKLWKTVLWLYPGKYEIKFIVDGHWRIDPQRESVTRGTIHNNILRVH